MVGIIFGRYTLIFIENGELKKILSSNGLLFQTNQSVDLITFNTFIPLAGLHSHGPVNLRRDIKLRPR